MTFEAKPTSRNTPAPLIGCLDNRKKRILMLYCAPIKSSILLRLTTTRCFRKAISLAQLDLSLFTITTPWFIGAMSEQ